MICSSLNRLPLIVRSSIGGRTLLKTGGDFRDPVTEHTVIHPLVEVRSHPVNRWRSVQASKSKVELTSRSTLVEVIELVALRLAHNL